MAGRQSERGIKKWRNDNTVLNDIGRGCTCNCAGVGHAGQLRRAEAEDDVVLEKA